MQARNDSDQEPPAECFSHAAKGANVQRLSAMGNEEDQETLFKEMAINWLKNQLG
jgi:hypothetical protein